MPMENFNFGWCDVKAVRERSKLAPNNRVPSRR
jgi:hypothetical protein